MKEPGFKPSSAYSKATCHFLQNQAQKGITFSTKKRVGGKKQRIGIQFHAQMDGDGPKHWTLEGQNTVDVKEIRLEPHIVVPKSLLWKEVERPGLTPLRTGKHFTVAVNSLIANSVMPY